MYVSIKCVVKEVFNKAVQPAVAKALQNAVTKAVDANSNFDTGKKDKVGIILTASVSVKADDKDAPKKLTTVLGIDGVLMGATGQAFKASGNGSMEGLSKKLDADAADLVDSVASDLMKNKVIPQMLKMKP